MLGAVVNAYNKSVPINTEREDKKTKLNLNNKTILLHWFITFPEGVYGGKGGKHGTFLIWTYGKKSWKFGFLGWGGYSVTSDLDLGKKVGNLDFWDFGFGLREKSWKFGFLGGGIL